MLRDYKEANEWMIGLLMLDPKFRKKGLAKIMHEIIVDFIMEESGDKIRIGVIDSNKSAIRFWKDLGYKEINKTRLNFGNIEHTIIMMNLLINHKSD